ncbi:MAG: glycosyltransferase family 4 protein [Elusimicrobia bacterium]|nr:glycosyltransferase family 4 protein [Elusimicrobiota bacterium]
MKILHVTNAVGWSGGMEQMGLLLAELKKRGHTNILVCPPGSELISQISPLGIPVHTVPMFQDYDLIAAYRCRRWISQYQPEIVHAHHPIAHAISLLALTATQKPAFVVSRRVSFSPRRNPFSLWKYQSGRIHAYTVVSQSVRQTLIQGGVEPSKIEVIYSAFDPKEFAPKSAHETLKQFLQIPAGHKVVSKIANVAPWKGQKIFLQAAQKALEIKPKIIFLLVGKGTDSLQPEAQRMGISQNVRLLGFREDVTDILSLTDLSVNSAIEGEGLSGAVRESLAMGIPVAASDVSGNREIVQDGKTGYLVAANNPDALARTILQALTDETLSKRMAMKGREWVLQNCSLQVMADKFCQLYERLVTR